MKINMKISNNFWFKIYQAKNLESYLEININDYNIKKKKKSQ